MKSITPVVSVILLIMLTIVASVAAYFFINSEVTLLESSGAIESSPYLDNSRLNLVSITGSQALVRNDGDSPVNELILFINGEVINYTLSSPIMPGDIREINYISQESGEDLIIKVIYNKGKEISLTSPARQNTQLSGFASFNFFEQCSASSNIASINNELILTNESEIVCGCGTYGNNTINNSDFEDNLLGWTYEGVSINQEGENNFVTFDAPNEIITQNVNLSSSISFDYYFSSDISNYLFMMGINVNTSTGDPEIYYVATDIPAYSSLCGQMLGTMYISCIEPNLGEWESATFYPKNDYETNFGANYSAEGSITLTFQALGSGNASFDNIIFINSAQGMTCDSRNDGVIDGYCDSSSCQRIIFSSASSSPYISLNNNLSISSTFQSISTPNHCKITIDGSQYFMNVYSTHANFSKNYPEGNYSKSYSIICSLIEDYSTSSTASFTVGRFSDFEEMPNSKVLFSNSDNFGVNYDIFYGDSNAYLLFLNSTGVFMAISSDDGETFSNPVKISGDIVPGDVPIEFYADDVGAYYLYANSSGLYLGNYSMSTEETFISKIANGDYGSQSYSFDVQEDIMRVTYYYSGNIYYINSSNKGYTFSSPITITSTSQFEYPIIKAYDQNVYIAYGNSNLSLIYSTNGGATFSSPLTVMENTDGVRRLNMDINSNSIHMLFRMSGIDGWYYSNMTHSLIGTQEFSPTLFLDTPFDSPNIKTNGSIVYIFDHMLSIKLIKSSNNGATFEPEKIISGYFNNELTAIIPAIKDDKMILLGQERTTTHENINENLVWSHYI